MVDIGPIMPTCAASAGPIRATASITASTGNTVQAVPLSSDSHHTAAGSDNSAPAGFSHRYWPMHSTQATVLA